MKNISIVIFLFLILILAYLLATSISSLNKVIAFSSEDIIEIERGSGSERIITIMNSKGALEPKLFYKYYLSFLARIENKYVKAGFYKFDSTMTNSQIIEALTSGTHQYTIRITIPEGLNYKEISEIIARTAGLDYKKLIKLCQSDSLLAARNIPAKNVEGYLLPDTYDFYPSANERTIIDRLLNEQEKLFTNGLSEKVKSFKLDKHEILTLASIIEAETPIDAEKRKVSGLYHNRLKKNMLLQADPTVQYALGTKRRLLYRDLEFDSKYNTYKYAGLPPGPINNPGKKSIIAAVEPENHNYLFMVATPDDSGWHNFSETYSKHLEFVKEFRKQNRAKSQ